MSPILLLWTPPLKEEALLNIQQVARHIMDQSHRALIKKFVIGFHSVTANRQQTIWLAVMIALNNQDHKQGSF